MSVKTAKTLLIVDDEANIRRILEAAFEKDGYEVRTAEDAALAIAQLERNSFRVVLTDVTMPGSNGYELQREIARRWPETEVVIMTAFGTIPQAVQAIRDGAFEFVTKPFDLDVLKRVVSAAVQPTASASKSKKKAQKKFEAKLIIAESPAMLDVVNTIQQVADSRATVLITGESGVGKEVAARLIHDSSPRNGQPYIAVSCAALPETLLESELFGYEKGAFTGAQGAKAGRFELANNGTLFLDEIGDIPMPIQIKLLRVLQEREFERLGATKPTKVDVRLVTATNRDLQDAVATGEFRMDLLYRLQVVEIHIPPLRSRREDILPLAEFFLKRICAENGRSMSSISQEAAHALLNYDWPGNVRELENTIERAVVLSSKDAEELSSSLLPKSLRSAA